MITPENLHKQLTVGEVAARSGVAVTALHFYETKGLIKSQRNAGNQRRYPREVLRRVALIKVAQNIADRIALANATAVPRGMQSKPLVQLGKKA